MKIIYIFTIVFSFICDLCKCTYICEGPLLFTLLTPTPGCLLFLNSGALNHQVQVTETVSGFPVMIAKAGNLAENTISIDYYCYYCYDCSELSWKHINNNNHNKMAKCNQKIIIIFKGSTKVGE